MPDPIRTNRGNITLPNDVSSEIIQSTLKSSAIMQLARRVPLPGRGITIPVITSDPEAAWVAETAQKPTSNPGLSQKVMQAYKLAVIVPFSDEFRRDLKSLYDAIVARLPGALGYAFDQTVVGAKEKPGENFDNLTEATAQSLIESGGTTTYGSLVAAYTDIAVAGGNLNGFALSPAGKGILLGAVDSVGRPLFIDSIADNGVPRVLGAATREANGIYVAGAAGQGSEAGTPALVGIAGDWSKAMFGTVEGVQISISNQATLTIGTTPVNLWERNMFAVRAEIEVGFRADVSCFNRLLGAIPTGA